MRIGYCSLEGPSLRVTRILTWQGMINQRTLIPGGLYIRSGCLRERTTQPQMTTNNEEQVVWYDGKPVLVMIEKEVENEQPDTAVC